MDETMEKRIYSLLSLCRKAGRSRSGERAVLECITSGEAKLVLIARDASDNSRKKLQDKCNYRRIPWRVFGERARLGAAMGVGERAGIAVTDVGLAGEIEMRLAAEGVSYGKD